MATESTVNVHVTCPVCKKDHVIVMPLQAFMRWEVEHMHIQDAWPNSTPAQREGLISGCHDVCFESLFGEDE